MSSCYLVPEDYPSRKRYGEIFNQPDSREKTLLTALGLLFGVGVFSSLGMRAVNQATETMLQDRMTTARLAADYVDEALGRALTELNKTNRS